jgi:membrane-bound lytic murein transglycosylase D
MTNLRIAGFGLALAAAASLLAGCEQTATKQVRATPPAPAPVPAPEPVYAGLLPLPAYAGPAFLRPLPVPGVDLLVASVQAAYDSGQKAYAAGSIDEAKTAFNHAIDLIMNSAPEVRTDHRLSDLFDEIVDTMHSYEIETQQEIEQTEAADTDEEQAGEPAPIEEIAGLNLPAGDPHLAVKAEKELITVPHDLPLSVNDSVLTYLSYFQTPHGREIVENGLRRSGRYRDMILRVLKQEGLPQDLIYLAQAESAFLPDAVSRAGARGIWQFVPFTGREYDLNRSWYVDERSDPEKSTHAAAQALRDLYQTFGDWYLVMAAYNTGPGNVVKAVERTGYADFWELQQRHALLRETQNYVPIIIALALVAKDPALYGIDAEPEKPAAVDIVKPGHSIDLRLVADAIDTDVDELHELNPELIRFLTPDDSDFELRVPKGTADKLMTAIAAIPPEHWRSWRLHEVESGDTLASVAHHYRVGVAALENANHFDAHEPLPVGQKIVVPAASPSVKLVRYRVRRGDTLEGIAEQFSVTVPDLKRWNGIHGNHVARGMRLRIYGGGEPRSTENVGAKSRAAGQAGNGQLQTVSHADSGADPAVEHKVKPGETLYSIARLYRTSVDALRHTNPFLLDRELEAGDVLKISHP